MRIYLIGLLCLISGNVISQPKVRKFSSIINHPSISVSMAYISADASAIIYVGNNGEGNAPNVNFSSRESDWRQPMDMPKFLNSKAAFLGGYCLSGDGKIMYFTTQKSPNLGGFDLQISEWKGSGWGEPVNPGKPINSPQHDGAPSLTPDGKTLYFMRCTSMDYTKASGCKIMSTRKKGNGQWEEPVELPENINTGNSQMPRILPDGETLYFASDKFSGSKGGYDLYMTRLTNGVWSTPVPLDFINTPENDLFVTVSAYGRFAIVTAKGLRNTEFVEVPIPEALRPKGLMRLDGKISSTGNAFVSVMDITSNQRVFQSALGTNGNFQVFLKEGSVYDVAVDPETSDKTYALQRYDLTTNFPEKEKFQATIGDFSPGTELACQAIEFHPGTSTLKQSSQSDLQRIIRLLKATPGTYEIQVMLNGYTEVMERTTDADLTEIVRDTVRIPIEKQVTPDSVLRYDSINVITRYHNDRTLNQGEQIRSKLISGGIPAESLTLFRNAIPTTDGRRKIIVKIRRKS